MKNRKPTLEEIKWVLQYLDEELLVEGTWDEVVEYVNHLEDERTDLDKLCDELEDLCGSHIWICDPCNGEIEIQISEDYADEVEEIIEKNDFEILDSSWFSGSDFDGYVITIRDPNSNKGVE